MVKRIICIVSAVMVLITVGSYNVLAEQDIEIREVIESLPFLCSSANISDNSYYIDFDILQPLELKLVMEKEIEGFAYEIYESEYINVIYLGIVRKDERVYCMQWINDLTLEEYTWAFGILDVTVCRSYYAGGLFRNTEYIFFVDGSYMERNSWSPTYDDRKLDVIIHYDSILSNFPELYRPTDWNKMEDHVNKYRE